MVMATLRLSDGSIADQSQAYAHSGNLSLNASVTSGNILLVACAGTRADTPSGDSDVWREPTKNAGTATIGSATLVKHQGSSGGYTSTITVWSIPITGSGTLTINCGDRNLSNGDDANHYTYGCGVVAFEISGHDAGDPFDGEVSEHTTTTDGAYSITLGESPTTSDIVIGFVNVDTDPGSKNISEGSGWTEVAELIDDLLCFEVETRTSTTSTSVAWSDLNTTGATAYNTTSAGLIVRNTASTPATATPSTVSSSTSVPAVGVSTEVDATVNPPSPVAISVTVSAPTIDLTENVSLTTTVVSLTTTIPTPTVAASTSATPTPSTIASFASIPDQAIEYSDIYSDTYESASLHVHTSTLSDITINPVTLIIPATVTGTPQLSPEATTATFPVTIPTPTVTGSNVPPSPPTVTVTATIPTPTFTNDFIPTTVSITTSIPTPTIVSSTETMVSPATIPLAATFPPPTIVSATLERVHPNTVSPATSIPTPTISYQISTTVRLRTVGVSPTISFPAISGPLDLSWEFPHLASTYHFDLLGD